MLVLSNPCYIYNNSPLFKGFEPSDVRILNLLVERRLQNYRLGFRTPTIAKMLGLDINEAKSALRFLHGGGWVEEIKRSRIRWRASTKAITAHGFAAGTQSSLERWL